MVRLLMVVFVSLVSMVSHANICSQLYNDKGVAFRYEVLGQSYSLKGYQRSPIFVNGLDYHYRLLGGGLKVSSTEVSLDYPGRFSYRVEKTVEHNKKHCDVVFMILISH